MSSSVYSFTAFRMRKQVYSCILLYVCILRSGNEGFEAYTCLRLLGSSLGYPNGQETAVHVSLTCV